MRTLKSLAVKRKDSLTTTEQYLHFGDDTLDFNVF